MSLKRDAPDTACEQPEKKFKKDDIARLIANGDAKVVKPSKKSNVWKKFGNPLVDGIGLISSFAVCDDCHAVYSYDSAKGNSTLANHRCSGKKTSLCFSMKDFLIKSALPSMKSLRKEDTETLNRAAVTCCAMDMRPLSMFTNDGIISFCQKLVDIAAASGRFDVKAELAHPTTLTRNHLKSMYAEMKSRVQQQFDHLDGMANLLKNVCTKAIQLT